MKKETEFLSIKEIINIWKNNIDYLIVNNPEDITNVDIQYKDYNNKENQYYYNSNFYYYEILNYSYDEEEDKSIKYYKLIINNTIIDNLIKIYIYNPYKFIFNNGKNDILVLDFIQYEWFFKENKFIWIDYDDDWNYKEKEIYEFTEKEIDKLNKYYWKKEKNKYSFFLKIKNLFS